MGFVYEKYGCDVLWDAGLYHVVEPLRPVAEPLHHAAEPLHLAAEPLRHVADPLSSRCHFIACLATTFSMPSLLFTLRGFFLTCLATTFCEPSFLFTPMKMMYADSHEHNFAWKLHY